jgi:acetyltransferase-like isoleucine patch superfamily enzyme
MTRGLRAVLLALTGLCPGPVKRAIYRTVFGYQIDRTVRIGFAYLDCRRLHVGAGVVIGHGVVFTRCGAVTIGEETSIGPLNLFRGGDNIDLGAYCTILRLNVFNAIPDHECTGSPDSSLSLGRGAVVTGEHRLDFTDRITLGRGAILAGRGTSLWTHNRRKSLPVVVGDYCYIGSETRMAPGAVIPNCCIVGLGSVVVRPFDEPYSLIAGVPAIKRRPLGPSDYQTIFLATRPKIPDDGHRPEAPPDAAPGTFRFEDYR